ncbi:MAG TPA: T9SS type A sorting domain-containing protein [Candidatus Cloacimonadota bacterium]|nr:T9SS type A sorting domain-containing protein [Candidatus Cloacimonadota bacterium]
MRMTVKKFAGVMFVMCLALELVAQVDSTFVRYYSPTYETHVYWYSLPTSSTYAGNVFEKYDGNFGMQILATFHTPPPEYIFLQSPIASYNRSGEYIDTTFGPYDDVDLQQGYYSHIIKDGYGGYLALDCSEHRIHRLNSNLQYVEWVPLQDDTGNNMRILDLIVEDNGFVAVARSGGIVIARFSYDLTCLWSMPLTAHAQISIKKLGDGAYVNMWWYSPRFRVMKISSTGDTIWTKQLQDVDVDDFIEVNNKYYGFKTVWIDNIIGELRIYDFGVDFENENPGEPILVMPTYPLYNELYGLGKLFNVIRTTDNCIILAVSTPSGEIFKFDSDLNLLWSSNALQNERIGIGFHPLTELGNGDFLYCATARKHPRQLALVRIDSNGNYVGIEDDTEQTPALPVISAYPNPFTGELNVELKNNTAGENKLDIYNIRGQLIESKSVRGSNTTWTPQNLATGVYILRLVSNCKVLDSKRVTYIK